MEFLKFLNSDACENKDLFSFLSSKLLNLYLKITRLGLSLLNEYNLSKIQTADNEGLLRHAQESLG